MDPKYEKYDHELDSTEELHVLAALIAKAMPPDVHLPHYMYANEILAVRDSERRALANGQWILTPIDEVIS